MLALSGQQLKAVIHTASMLSRGRHGQTVLKDRSESMGGSAAFLVIRRL